MSARDTLTQAIARGGIDHVRLLLRLHRDGRLSADETLLRMGNLFADEQHGGLPGETLRGGDWGRVGIAEWLITGLVPFEPSLALVYGPSGSFKSFLALDLALALSQGQVFLPSSPNSQDSSPSFQGGPCPVLYLATEDAAVRLKSRLSELARFRELENWHGLDVHLCRGQNGNGTHFLLSNAADRKRLSNMTAVEGYRLVIIDTLAESVRGIDEIRSQDMGLVIDWAREVMATGASVLIVHHVRKPPSGTNAAKVDATDPANVRGNSSLLNASDLALGVVIIAQGEVRFRVSKSRILERFPDMVVEVRAEPDPGVQAKFLFLRDFLGLSDEKRREREHMIERAVEVVGALSSEKVDATAPEVGRRLGTNGDRARGWLMQAAKRGLLVQRQKAVGRRELTCYDTPE